MGSGEEMLEAGNEVPSRTSDGFPRQPAEGYDRLGRLMGRHPETTAFRRFGELAAEDLLYRQAELAELERSLREYQKADKESGNKTRQGYALSWNRIQASSEEDAQSGHNSSQLETILEIREKLERYHNALLRYRRVLELQSPLPDQVTDLDTWMQRPSMGNVFLQGPDRYIWSQPNLDDMVTLKPPSPEDSFTSKPTQILTHYYHALLGKHIHREESAEYLKNTIHYRDEKIFQLLKWLITLVACLLPIVGIVILYVIKSMPARLAAIAAFTAIFSTFLNIMTTASTKDIFGATAAFAAVLVVFIGTSDSSTPVMTP